jgi:glycosyltransferase involved in cell wall biosynthesis
VTDGVEGFLVPQHDPRAMADAAARLYESYDRLRELGRNARMRFEREFDLRLTESVLHDRLREILAARSRGAPR